MKTLSETIPRKDFDTILNREKALWPRDLDFAAEEIQSLYDQNMDTDISQVFEEAWDMGTGVIEALARVWIKFVGETNTTLEVESLKIGTEELRLVPGHLKVAKDVYNDGILIVAGNAIVANEFGDSDVGRTSIIGGNLSCKLSNTQGALYVLGNLNASALVYGNYHEDRIIVRGELSTPLCVLEGKTLEAGHADALIVKDEISIETARMLESKVVSKFLLPTDVRKLNNNSIPLRDILKIDELYSSIVTGTKVFKTTEEKK